MMVNYASYSMYMCSLDFSVIFRLHLVSGVWRLLKQNNWKAIRTKQIAGTRLMTCIL